MKLFPVVALVASAGILGYTFRGSQDRDFVERGIAEVEVADQKLKDADARMRAENESLIANDAKLKAADEDLQATVRRYCR